MSFNEFFSEFTSKNGRPPTCEECYLAGCTYTENLNEFKLNFLRSVIASLRDDLKYFRR